MKTSNKIIFTGAATLVVSILVNIGIDIHAYRRDNAWLLQLDSLLQQRTIRVVVEQRPFEGYCYQRFKTREEQEKTGRFSSTLFFPGTTPPTPETVRIEGDTLFLDAPVVAGYFPNAEVFVGSDGKAYNILGIRMFAEKMTQFEKMEIER